MARQSMIKIQYFRSMICTPEKHKLWSRALASRG